MDDVLRRRLVGAAVLFGAAFLFASLLPGPQPVRRPGTVVTYDLRTGEPIVQAEPTADLPAPAARTPPAPAAPAIPGSPRPNLKVDDTLGAAQNAGRWYVQVGSFESQANARAVLQKLYGAGLPTVIQSVKVGKVLWYRVRVGPYGDEAGARKALGTVQQQGYKAAKVVRPEEPGADRN